MSPAGPALRLLTTIVAGLYVGIAALLGLVGVLDTLLVLQRSLATVLLVVGLGQIWVSRIRVRLRHWQVQQLRARLWRELGLCGVIVTLDGAAGWVLPVAPLALVLLLVPLIGVCAMIDALSTSIAITLAEEQRLRSVTAYVGSCEFYGRITGTRKSFRESVNEARAGVVANALSVLLELPPRPAMSRIRVVVTTTLLIAAFGQGALAFAALVADHSRTSERLDTTDTATAPSYPPPLHSATGGEPSSPRPAPTAPATTEWDDVCPANPGTDAPSWAAAELDSLYLGPADDNAPPEQVGPPGADGGCTGHVVVPDPSMRFAYVRGTDPVTGRLISVAVASDDVFPPALFMAPAAHPVLDIIRDQRPLGGSPRYRVRHGDFQLAWTTVGTTAFVRATVWTEDAGPRRAQPYTQLPPAATDAWLDAMRATGSWLWPSATSDGSNTHIRLLNDAIAGREVATIDYTDARGNAQLRQGSLVRDYAPRGNRVSDIELLDLSRTAR